MAGGARLRVRIDVQKVRSNMQMQGRQLTEGDIEAWLRVVGFEPEPGAPSGSVSGTALTCLTDPENLRCLDPSEVLEVTPAG
jgi:hypothetical protein